MCVLKEFQNNGIGNKLLLEAERYCISFKINNLWMNAREKALNFYLSSNYKDLGISYEIEGIGLHYFLYKKLK
jgi:ribosomal protein S18 acetylase RimI-like enzyme